MKKFNYVFHVQFSVESDSEVADLTKEEMINALQKRVDHLKEKGDKVFEACGSPEKIQKFECPFNNEFGNWWKYSECAKCHTEHK